MSTYWNIECRRCGLEVFEDDYGWTNRRGEEFASLCALDLLDTKPMATNAWRVAVIDDFDRRIDLARLNTGCDHDFEPRNEYGEWALPEMWPDWHTKGRVIEGTQPTDCSGLGDIRCIE